MSSTLTIHLDESGTPLTGVDGDGIFVVGGVGFVGDPSVVSQASGGRLPEYKGTKFSAADFLSLAEFLSESRVVPIASHCRLTADDQEQARSKALALQERLRGDGGTENITPAAYLWPLQIAHTVVVAALGSLPSLLGEIDRVDVFVDEYGLPELADHLTIHFAA